MFFKYRLEAPEILLKKMIKVEDVSRPHRATFKSAYLFAHIHFFEAAQLCKLNLDHRRLLTEI